MILLDDREHPTTSRTHLLPDLLTRDDLRATLPLAVVLEDWVKQP